MQPRAARTKELETEHWPQYTGFSLRSVGLIPQGLPPTHAVITGKRPAEPGPGLDTACMEKLGSMQAMVSRGGESREEPSPQACAIQTLWDGAHAVEVSFWGRNGAQCSSICIVSTRAISGPTKRQSNYVRLT